MKVLHIIAGAKEGGAESCAIDTIRALGNKGIEQTLICRPHPNFLKLTKDCELKSYTLRFSPLLKWLQKIRINLIIKEEKPDLIHCWMNRAASFTPKQANYSGRVLYSKIKTSCFLSKVFEKRGRTFGAAVIFFKRF